MSTWDGYKKDDHLILYSSPNSHLTKGHQFSSTVQGSYNLSKSFFDFSLYIEGIQHYKFLWRKMKPQNIQYLNQHCRFFLGYDSKDL